MRIKRTVDATRLREVFSTIATGHSKRNIAVSKVLADKVAERTT